MRTPNLKSVAVGLAIPEAWTKFQNLKVGQGDPDYDPFDLLCTAYFVLLTDYLLAKFEACSFSRSRDILTAVGLNSSLGYIDRMRSRLLLPMLAVSVRQSVN